MRNHFHLPGEVENSYAEEEGSSVGGRVVGRIEDGAGVPGEDAGETRRERKVYLSRGRVEEEGDRLLVRDETGEGDSGVLRV